MKKILILHDVYEHTGGAETYVEAISESLEKEFEVYRISQSFNFENKIGKNIVYKNKKSNPLKKYLDYYIFDFNFYHFLKKSINNIQPDLIHIHHNNIHPFPILNIIKKYKTIQTIHDYGLLCPRGGFALDSKKNFCVNSKGLRCLRCIPKKNLIFLLPIKLKNRIMKKNINLFIAPSEKLREGMIKNGFEKTILLNYFVNKDFIKSQNKKKFYEDRKKLLYVGGLTEHKGIHILIQAISDLPPEYKKKITLNVVGKGYYEGELLKLIKNLKLEKIVNFVGYSEGKKLQNYYDQAYTLIVPSLWVEQFGIVGLEAMACGTPCIGSNIGGIPEWINNKKDGLLFKSGDSKELTEKIKFLLDNPETAEKFGIEAKKKIEKNFLKEDHIKKLTKIYNQVIYEK